MTIWTPNLSNLSAPPSRPKYLLIADAIADAISSGELEAEQKLPTHRDLAYRLGVTVGTVSRAYAEIARQGLTSGEVGRGTFVRDMNASSPVAPFDIQRAQRKDIIDLSVNRPTTGRAGEYYARTLAQLSKSNGLDVLTEYQPSNGMPVHRQAGAKLISKLGLETNPDTIILTNGVQHAMAAVFMTLAKAGDTVLCEDLTFPALKALSQSLGFNLKGLPMDAEGLLPDALEDACRQGLSKILFTMPTLQNPTGSIQSMERRRKIAEIAERHDLTIIEDDVYGFLPDKRPPPLAAFAPDRVVYMTSTAKSLAPGLRVGYLSAPERMMERLGNAVRMTGWMIPPLMGEIASRWIFDNIADELIKWHRENARFRMALASRIFQDLNITRHTVTYHLWLKLPEGIRIDEFMGACTRRSIAVSGPLSFTVGNSAPPSAIRVCLGSTQTMSELEKGLTVLRDIIDNPPEPDLSML